MKSRSIRTLARTLVGIACVTAFSFGIVGSAGCAQKKCCPRTSKGCAGCKSGCEKQCPKKTAKCPPDCSKPCCKKA